MKAPVILTVDDSRVLRLSLVELFRPYDCQLVQAADGLLGLAAVREHHPEGRQQRLQPWGIEKVCTTRTELKLARPAL